MNDLLHASTLLIIYALALAGYGAILAKTGNKNLVPLRASHSIRSAAEVKAIGKVVIVFAAGIFVIAFVLHLFAGL